MNIERLGPSELIVSRPEGITRLSLTAIFQREGFKYSGIPFKIIGALSGIEDPKRDGSLFVLPPGGATPALLVTSYHGPARFEDYPHFGSAYYVISREDGQIEQVMIDSEDTESIGVQYRSGDMFKIIAGSNGCLISSINSPKYMPGMEINIEGIQGKTLPFEHVAGLNLLQMRELLHLKKDPNFRNRVCQLQHTVAKIELNVLSL